MDRTPRPWPWPALAAGLAGSLAVPLALVCTGWAEREPTAGGGAAQVAGGEAAVFGVVVYAVGAAAVAVRWPRRVLGAANAVTLLRLVIVSWLAGLLAVPDPGVWRVPVVVAALCCLALDGVDGRVARRRGLVSAFGARFDIEVDAALALILSVAVVGLGVAGWWVVSLGLVRYVYVAASLRWAWLRGALFPSRARKVIGVCEVAVLVVALLSPLLTPNLTGPAAAWPTVTLLVTLGAVCWSFARDVRWKHAIAKRSRAAWWLPGSAPPDAQRFEVTPSPRRTGRLPPSELPVPDP
ncbi:phosphatidylglycerophosphate synthase [Georgenia soli]|uniref:Phosphatidylglycerophosphate synthase n=1 Tax=Georgenia soli TaxID=638953 RepID=A0A2A9ESG8_9MICO|nr:CDP-alcohol phosphatidyltransferase family protein [Georgenia soli]PFG41149.1 phosphatidylglycerophosphate synthase [Georgenia soli]